MKLLISPEDILSANKQLKFFGGKVLVKLFMRITKLNRLNKFYSQNHNLPVFDFNEKILREFNINYSISDDLVKKIPQKGSFILISNHPTGGGESIILLNSLLKLRSDFKFMANFLLQRIEPLKDYLMSVNPFEDRQEAFSSMTGIKNSLQHLNNGGCLGIFPAGEVSTYDKRKKCITDKEWDPVILKLIKKANVPVIPVFIDAHNSKLFYWLGKIHPLLRTLKLPSELINKKNNPFRITVGNPICVADIELFDDLVTLGEFLRFKTFSLKYIEDKTSVIESNKFFTAVVDETPVNAVKEDIAKLPEECMLASVEEYNVYYSLYDNIPNVMREISRLREITYREIGEGTGKAYDTDKYDKYYYHLFIWDKASECLVGAYRMGKGADLFSNKGISGFYCSSLFEIHPDLYPVLNNTIELGRSFIRPEYQKKTLPLFLLWKGILYFLKRNPEYRYLVGPVSISDALSHFSKGLILSFLQRNYNHQTFSPLIRPFNPFKFSFPADIDIQPALEYMDKDVSRLDKIIHDIEPKNNIPVLLKKYLKQNARILSSNIDPAFNNCLDVLMLLDMKDVPLEVIESLSKELSDKTD